MTEKPAKRGLPSPVTSSIVGEGRDQEVLASIAWAGVLTTSQVERLHFPSRRRAQRRLRALLDHQLVRAHLQGEALQRENVYTVTELGIDQLIESGFFLQGAPAPARVPRPQHLAHTIAVRDVFVAAVLAERAGHFQIASLEFGSELRADPVLASAHLEPDALLSLAQGELAQLVGVEVDRGTETTTTLRTKFDAWRRVLAAAGGRRRFDTAALLVAAPRDARCRTLRRLLDEAGITLRARVVLLADTVSLLASGWPFASVALHGRTPPPHAPAATFAEFPADDGFVALPVRPMK